MRKDVRKHKSILNRHIKKIYENEHQCNSNDRVHNCKNNLAGHIEYAHDKKCETQIETCNTADTGKPSLQKHGKRVHNNMKMTYTGVMSANLTNKHRCGMCERTYKHECSLKRHIKKMHEKETNVKHKLQSPRSMERTSLKEYPKSDYTNTGNLRCDSCMKTYKYRGHLERHIKLVHHKEQESRCERCNLAFKEISKFRRHMTTKHDEPKPKLKEYPKSIININEHRIDNKNSFKYLGTKLACGQPSAGDAEVKHCKI